MRNLKLQNAINEMAEQLKVDFGADYSYIVCGQGKVIAASTKDKGRIPE